MEVTETCEVCYYYNEKYKDCRRFPPQLILVEQQVLPDLGLVGGSQSPRAQTARLQYGFPKILKDGWCGEWSPLEEEE